MHVPCVSVCIPTFNMGRFLGEAIQSVVQQTYSDFEIVICDNCSTDNTVEVVGRFRDPRVRYVVNEHNLGMYGNFNRTIEHARGRYLKFLCADDRIHPQYIEKAMAFFETFPRIGVVTALHTGIDANGRVISRHAPSRLKGPTVIAGQEMLGRAPWRHNEIGTPSHAMLRREVFENVGGFDLDYSYANDWEMWLRVFSQYDAGFLRDYLVEIRIHPEQQSFAPEATFIAAHDVFRISQAHYAADWWQRQVLIIRNAEVYLWAAVMRFLRGQRTDARRMLRLVTQNSSRPLLVAYVAFHSPFWFWRGLRRRYCLLTGKVWET